ncbi:MAG: response regulator [Chromatiaceae bacterium]|nr:response regulator [Gammaproteobacteria bacterium]MCP5428225.1 response regulator [Chromatiaceae bacterium]MCB1861187.1 response regulator [Gammaproteobacteria bacterium]MCB1872283.1 response regulator [Gammaproteobacteria bacterium]MCB1878952.1 response regulator [Gammaproteobacteria bacterium]
MSENLSIAHCRTRGCERFAEAENGIAAAQLISKRYFDLIIADCKIPGIDGGEIPNYIRNNST